MRKRGVWKLKQPAVNTAADQFNALSPYPRLDIIFYYSPCLRMGLFAAVAFATVNGADVQQGILPISLNP
jgi:hypothetical protein